MVYPPEVNITVSLCGSHCNQLAGQFPTKGASLLLGFAITHEYIYCKGGMGFTM